jgi:hypothetical protein
MRCTHARSRIAAALDRARTVPPLAVDQHLARCAACRAYAAGCRALHDELLIAGRACAGPEFVDSVMRSIANPDLVRKPMHSTRLRTWKIALAVAVAAAAILFGTTTWWPFGGRPASIAYAAMMRTLQEAETVVITSTIEGETSPAETIEASGERIRLTSADRIAVLDLSVRRGLLLELRTRVATEFRPELAPLNFYQRLRSLTNEPAEEIGVRMVDGRALLAFRVRSAQLGAVDVLVDQAARRPVQIESLRDARRVVSRIDFDVPIDVRRFELTLPDGYTLRRARDGEPVGRAGVSRAMVGILMACQTYMQSAEQWPADIAGLAPTYIAAEQLHHPACPDRPIGFTYIPPAGSPPGSRLVLHECFDSFGDGVLAGFADTSVRVIGDEAEFRRLVAEAQANRRNP